MDDRNAPTLAAMLDALVRLESDFATWDADARASVAAYREAIDALNGEALRRLIRTVKAEPAALAALKQAAADEVVHAVLRHHEIVKPSLNERIEAALAGVRPALAAHDGDVELVGLAPPTVEVRFTGACDGCAASALTFRDLVAKAVQAACPEITSVIHRPGVR
jgi:Fe-S cluster biogenesis protein NfuA